MHIHVDKLFLKWKCASNNCILLVLQLNTSVTVATASYHLYLRKMERPMRDLLQQPSWFPKLNEKVFDILTEFNLLYE